MEEETGQRRGSHFVSGQSQPKEASGVRARGPQFRGPHLVAGPRAVPPPPHLPSPFSFPTALEAGGSSREILEPV